VKRRTETSNAEHDRSFYRELRSLRLLHQLKHNNIVPLLGSYTHNDEHHFLFPCLDMDLKHFLNLDHRYGDFCWDSTFSFALSGLASALESTHDLHLTAKKDGIDFDSIGYHYDVRPANVLVDKNRFVLSDFGLGTLKSAEEESATPWKGGCGDYIAPECMDASGKRQQVGRGVDVWAFGCLVADVVTFMKRGPKGVLQFRQSRLGKLSDAIPFESTFFYDSSGQLKGSVHHWLNDLGTNSHPSTAALIRIALEALEPDPSKRPQMRDLRRKLSTQSLLCLYDTLLGKMSSFLEMASHTNQELRLPNIWLWFDFQCIQAYETILRSSPTSESSIINDAEKYKRCSDTMRDLLGVFDSELMSCKDNAQAASPLTEEIFDLRAPIEERIHNLVQNLWKLSPPQLSRKAQVAWLHLMPMDGLHTLSHLDTRSRPGQVDGLADASAIAQMQSLRHLMLSDPSAPATEYRRPLDQLGPLQFVGGHEYRTFRGEMIVLMEWTYFGSRSEKVRKQQRLAIMELRCENFATDPKPTGLRTLRCLGFVEKGDENNLRIGYGFMYELPTSAVGRGELPVTLQSLLDSGLKAPQNRPPLAGRFRLAYALASFFVDFYAVGCLHESFNSKNILFSSGPPSPFKSLDAWSEPYVVGLHRCRPDKSSWDTEGPPDKDSVQLHMELYQHPDYRQQGRFRLEYDYYSLGVVFLELGLWYPLQAWSEKSEYNNMSLGRFRKIMIGKYVPRLTAHVGDVYRRAVLACLDGTLESRANTSTVTESKRTFDMFFDEVFTPLQKLSLLEI
jgi:serine/threonine protein kinase